MKCPVCGAKMIDGKICKYCGVTCEQVLNASNQEAKRAFKEGRRKDVCYTTDMPKDVNKRKLVLLTAFLGLFGVGNFYVGKNIKGIYCAVSYGLAIVFTLLSHYGTLNGWSSIGFINICFSIATYLMIVNLLFWLHDMVGFMFKMFKVPVVLASEEVKMKHHSLKKHKGN